MNFETAPTSDKLYFLANHLSTTHAARFNRWDIFECIIAIGNAIQNDGTLKDLSGFDINDEVAFAEKFGVTGDETYGLNFASYARLKIGMPDHEEDTNNLAQDNLLAIEALRKLADRYLSEGK